MRKLNLAHTNVTRFEALENLVSLRELTVSAGASEAAEAHIVDAAILIVSDYLPASITPQFLDCALTLIVFKNRNLHDIFTQASDKQHFNTANSSRTQNMVHLSRS